MGNTVEVRHYFMEAFTPHGYISLLPELLQEVKYTYFLTGGPGTGKSTMIKLVGIQLIDRGYEVDYIRSVREPDSVAGLFLPQHKIAVLDQNEFKALGPDLHAEYHREIDFTIFCRKTRLAQYSHSIQQLSMEISALEEQLIGQLQKEYGGAAQQNPCISLKKLFDCAEEEAPATDEISEILAKIKKNLLTFRFLHGIQLDGWLNLAPRYLKDFDRICLEGVDSAEILRGILMEVKSLGQVIEIIVHPLKPYSLVGIVFPEKNLAVWKGNPCRQEEQGLMRQHSPELYAILERYRKLRIELKNIINDTVIFRGLEDLRSELLSSILADLRQKDRSDR